MSLLSIRNLTTVFNCPEGKIRACNNISIDLNPGQTLGLIGETGCGKSVLGMSILRLLPSNAQVSGQIIYNAQDLLTLPLKEMGRVRGSEIGFLPQSPATSLNPVLRIGEQVAEGLKLHRGMSKEKAVIAARKILESLGFRDAAKRSVQYPHQLSGGMKQRALAAISITGKPSLLIADEPTKGLDAVVRAQVIALLRQLTRETNAALLVITHDLKVAASLCDEIAVMYCGEVVEKGPAGQVLSSPSHPYTRGLIASLPDRGLHPIPGYTPSSLDDTQGCRFYSRCPYKYENCKIEPIVSREVNGIYVRCLYVGQGGGTQQRVQDRGFQAEAV
ncbi:MAG: ABC transporter ATP-binding protein [Syntrophomonas sp.]